MLDLLSGEPSELTELALVRSKPVPFPPEPLGWAVIEATRWSIAGPTPTTAAGTCGCAPSTGWASGSTPERPPVRLLVG